jgi:hypothetical protein
MEQHSNPTPSANPRGLGITVCTSCGRPESVVGKLGVIEQHPGTCHYCAHDLERYEVLADELHNLVWPWVQACRERGVSDREVEEVVDIVRMRFFDPGPPAPTCVMPADATTEAEGETAEPGHARPRRRTDATAIVRDSDRRASA